MQKYILYKLVKWISKDLDNYFEDKHVEIANRNDEDKGGTAEAWYISFNYKTNYFNWVNNSNLRAVDEEIIALVEFYVSHWDREDVL